MGTPLTYYNSSRCEVPVFFHLSLCPLYLSCLYIALPMGAKQNSADGRAEVGKEISD